MAKYKHYDLNQTKMIPLSYTDQIVEGSFEYALNEIVEEHLDLTVFEHHYRNDETGRSAYDPKVLLKVVLYGYSRRMGTVEPVFANIQNKGMRRFTLRNHREGGRGANAAIANKGPAGPASSSRTT